HTYKAFLVAKDFTYEVDYEETFSPVADIRAIRILIPIAVFYDYEIWQMDVKNAFLNRHLFKEVYMVQPKENSLIAQEASGSLEDLEIIQEEDTHPSIDTSLNHEEDDQDIDEPQTSGSSRRKPTWMELYTPIKLVLWQRAILKPQGLIMRKPFLMLHVVDIRAIRILIAIAAFYDYEIWQMDVKTAFLNGYLSEEVYMEQPEGFVNPKYPNQVCKLKRSIYGLKQASRQWNKRFDDEIKKFGFIQNRDEPCVYLKASGSNITFLILYVDDILIMGNHIPMLQDVKSYLGRCFAMKDLGEAAYILGIKIYKDRSWWLIEYVFALEYVFASEAVNDEMDSIIGNNTWILVDLPLGSKAIKSKWIFKRKLRVDGSIEKLVAKGFTQKEGLDYFDTYAPIARTTTIRILIALASINKLIIHQMDVKTAFLNGELEEEVYMGQPEGFIIQGQENKVCKLIKSLYGLKQAPKQWHQNFDQVILSNGFRINDSDNRDPSVLEGYTDASWITDQEDYASTSEWIFTLGGGTVSWGLKKHSCLTDSTMAAEFVALASRCKK
nr:zinc finger, CCHC-type [Tanacetum cinerariifolium]